MGQSKKHNRTPEMRKMMEKIKGLKAQLGFQSDLIFNQSNQIIKQEQHISHQKEIGYSRTLELEKLHEINDQLKTQQLVSKSSIKNQSSSTEEVISTEIDDLKKHLGEAQVNLLDKCQTDSQ